MFESDFFPQGSKKLGISRAYVECVENNFLEHPSKKSEIFSVLWGLTSNRRNEDQNRVGRASSY